jgi:glycosyltransferase 2 family protein
VTRISARWPRRFVCLAALRMLTLSAVLVAVGWQLHASWRNVELLRAKAVTQIDWRWSGLALLGFTGVLLTGASVWYWLLRRMDRAGSPLALYGAYCFSQMGKYVPGKIVLLLMRIERAGHVGVSTRTIALSTVMENAASIISSAGTAVVLLVPALTTGGGRHRWLLLLASCSMTVLLISVHPAVFYRILDSVLRTLRRPAIEPDQRVPMRALLAAVLAMTPCWFFGGFALWASARCLVPIAPGQFWSLMSAFAVSVLAGAVSFLPGGLGVRELVQGRLLLPLVRQAIPVSDPLHGNATLVVALIVVLQRVFQITTEAALSLLGAAVMAHWPARSEAVPLA